MGTPYRPLHLSQRSERGPRSRVHARITQALPSSLVHVRCSTAAMRPFLLRLHLLLTLLTLSTAARAAAPSPRPPLTLDDPPTIAGRQTSLDGLRSLQSRNRPSADEWRATSLAISWPQGSCPSRCSRATPSSTPPYGMSSRGRSRVSREVELSVEQVAALQSDEATSDVWLVFDGIKTGANIVLNGALLAVSRHQFLRQQLSLRSLIRKVGLEVRVGASQLQVEFDPAVNEYGQFMSCSGG